MLTVGDKFPSFALTAVTGTNAKTAFAPVTNESYDGKWLVVFAWPKKPKGPTDLIGRPLFERPHHSCRVRGRTPCDDFSRRDGCGGAESHAPLLATPIRVWDILVLQRGNRARLGPHNELPSSVQGADLHGAA